MGFPDRHRPRRITGHPHAQGPGHRRDRGEDIGTVARQPVAHEAPIGHPGDENVPRSDAVVVLQLVHQPDQEGHIVDVAAIRGRCATPVGPAPVVTVGVDHQQVVGISNGVEARQAALREPGTPPPCKLSTSPTGSPAGTCKGRFGPCRQIERCRRCLERWPPTHAAHRIRPRISPPHRATTTARMPCRQITGGASPKARRYRASDCGANGCVAHTALSVIRAG